jgi:hypothetical protein
MKIAFTFLHTSTNVKVNIADSVWNQYTITTQNIVIRQAPSTINLLMKTNTNIADCGGSYVIDQSILINKKSIWINA